MWLSRPERDERFGRLRSTRRINLDHVVAWGDDAERQLQVVDPLFFRDQRNRTQLRAALIEQPRRDSRVPSTVDRNAREQSVRTFERAPDFGVRRFLHDGAYIAGRSCAKDDGRADRETPLFKYRNSDVALLG